MNHDAKNRRNLLGGVRDFGSFRRDSPYASALASLSPNGQNSVHRTLLPHQKIRDFNPRDLVVAADAYRAQRPFLDQPDDGSSARHEVWRELAWSEAPAMRDAEVLGS